jgi:putative oxidoreductase
MTLKRFLLVPQISSAGDAALLLLRLLAGVAFMLHGWSKIQNPFGWMGPDAFAPPFFQFLAALSEFGGGLAWVLGLLMPLASLGIAATMGVAAWFHAVSLGHPFVATKAGPSFELAALYLSISLLFLALGPGRFALDAKLFGRR